MVPLPMIECGLTGLRATIAGANFPPDSAARWEPIEIERRSW